MTDSRNVVIISETSHSEEQIRREEKKDFFLKYLHQIIALSLIHITFMIFEGLKAFKEDWISAIIYGFIVAGTMAFIVLQRKEYYYLIPIPFISLIINAAILLNPVTVTAIFFTYLVFFFILLLLEKKTIETILTISFSGLTLFLLTTFMLLDRGFVQVFYEINVVSFAWLMWFALSTTLAFLQNKKFSVTLTYAITAILFSSIGPCLTPETGNSNFFIVLCFIMLLATAIISAIIIFLENNYNIGRFLGLIAIAATGTVVFSYTFNIFFDWIASGLSKALLVDYVLFIPITLFTIGFMFWKMFKQPPTQIRREGQTYSNEETENDGILLGIFFILIIFSQLMNFNYADYNLIKGLIISFITLAAAIPLNLRLSSIFSILGTMTFLGLVLGILGELNIDYVLIILMSLSAVLLLLAVFNELFFLKEPLTTSLSMSGSVALMLSTFLYFEYLNIFIDIIWAITGLFLFTVGIIFNKIYLRRTGLIIIIVDIVYTIIQLLIDYWNVGWILGVGFMVVSIVLIGCIFLFRWSERKYRASRTIEQTNTNQ